MNEPRREPTRRPALAVSGSVRTLGLVDVLRVEVLLVGVFLVALPLLAPVAATAQKAPEATTGSLDQELQQMLAAGRYAEAEERLRQLGDSGSVRALLALARLEAGRGRAEDAADTLRRALVLAPNAEEVLSAFSRVHLGAGRPARALLALEALARMHPGVADHSYLLGVARLQVGDLDGAAEILFHAIELEPTVPRHHLACGLALNRLKRFDEALQTLRRALALAPESPSALAALAEAEEGLGRRDDAARHARAALTARAAMAADDSEHTGLTDDSATATAHFVLGRLAMQERDYETARTAFERALESADDAAKVHYQLSLAYARLGDTDRSRHHRDTYLRLLQDAKDRLVALRRAPPLTATETSTAPPDERTDRPSEDRPE